MGTKRPYSDVHPSRREQVPQISRKRAKPDNLGSKSYKKARPVNELKTRLRDITRLLARTDDNLPAHIRISKERELQAVQHELQETQTAERRSRMIARYHKIRFFDRQKASKRLRKAQKLLDALGNGGDTDEIRQRQHEVDEAQVDVNYAMYYPLDKPYNSLFPKDDEQEATQEDATEPTAHRRSARDTHARGDPEMRQLVKQCMTNGKLGDLRHGKITNAGASAETEGRQSSQKTKPATGKTTKAGRETKHNQHATQADSKNDVDDESDGGFFE